MLIPEIVRGNSISGGYTRGASGTECRWTVWHNPVSNCFETYTRGDSKSPCDIGWFKTDRQNARVFTTQEAALAYLSKVIGA